MKTIIIADNLVNDYCGYNQRYVQNHVFIGVKKRNELLGSKDEQGPLINFVKNQFNRDDDLIFLRDSYQEGNASDDKYLVRYGDHCLYGKDGSEFIDPLIPIVDESEIINCTGTEFPLSELDEYFSEKHNIDIINDDAIVKNDIRILIIGFHTERRILSLACTLKNTFKFPHVAVFSHFMAGLTKESHYVALRHSFPDNFIEVLSSIQQLELFMDQDLDYLKDDTLHPVQIKPEQYLNQLNDSQKLILESICMHWSEVDLKPLSGGFSGSLLFIAKGMEGKAVTEPMVIKIDYHTPIRKEIAGYNLVKNFLGKHIPTFTFPVSVGQYSGIGMELASMEGSPLTLQSFFERGEDDYTVDKFLDLFDHSISMLTERVYKNTLELNKVAPFRHFTLHISNQSIWFKGNLENIKRHDQNGFTGMSEAVFNMFNLIRTNADAIKCQMSVGHGDLNFANIIVDEKENLWTIDWTHADLHPLAIDFTKMENDLKFVMSKDLCMDDLDNLKLMEDYILEKIVPCDVEDLPANLNFIKWDIRFKKIYKAIRLLRMAFNEVSEDENFLIYKVGLLRYALHTLSFDKTISKGECSPAQLLYTYSSIETICFALMADDYHLKIRSEKPDDYPERQRIQIDYTNWQVPCPEYSPPFYFSVSKKNISNEELVEIDPEDDWEYNKIVDWSSEALKSEEGKPLNPRGRTGIVGRGHFWYWGSNPMLFLLPVRYIKNERVFELLAPTNTEANEIVNFHYRKEDNDEKVFRRVLEKIQYNTEELIPVTIHKGYLYDYRQTDNSWVDALSYLLISDFDQRPDDKESRTKYEWKRINPEMINRLSFSHSYLIRAALSQIKETDLCEVGLIDEILNKTG